jgi:S-(hydroxymethyl)glutathione dehydrogenase/alcohol dehydrogenase
MNGDMKGLVYHGPMDVRVDDKPKPNLKDPEDIVLKVTEAAICGSDLHLFHGSFKSMEPGQTLGHEFAGIVEQVGDKVTEVKEGDRVVIPFNIHCGKCWFCRNHLWSQCDRANPMNDIGGMFGYGQITGGYDGGQAEYVRVPFANAESIKIPDQLSEEQVLFLSDALCTGYFAADMAEVQVGDDVAVFGAGPVGYFAVMSALLRGAAKVFVIDHWPYRLDRTAKLGAEPINFDREDPVERIRHETRGKGAKCIDAVGYEAVGHHNHEKSANPAYVPVNSMQVLTWILQSARKGSAVSIAGVYGTEYVNFPLGQFFNRNIQIKMGQCPVRRYSDQLLHMIETGRIDPTQVISHRMKLEEAAKGYQMFDGKAEVHKIVLTP